MTPVPLWPPLRARGPAERAGAAAEAEAEGEGARELAEGPGGEAPGREREGPRAARGLRDEVRDREHLQYLGVFVRERVSFFQQWKEIPST